MLLSNLEKYSDSERIAIYSGKNGMTYRELWKRTEAVAWFIRENYNTDSPIGIYGDKETDMVVCMFAAVKAGKTYVNLSSVYPDDHIKFVLSDSCPDLIFNMSSKIIDFGVDTFNSDYISKLTEKYAGYPVFDYQITEDDTALIIYTSGSSGMPKGVELSYKNIENKKNNGAEFKEKYVDEEFGVYRDTIMASYAFAMSLSFFYIIGELAGTIYSTTIDEIRDSSRITEYLRWGNPNWFALTPSLATRLLKCSNFRGEFIPDVRAIALSGEHLSCSLASELIRRFPKASICNSYGATETSGAAVNFKVTEEFLKKGEQFAPITLSSDKMIFLVDEDGNRINREGEQGELVFCGDMIAKGYYNNPELTDASFFNLEDGTRAFRTGDMAYIKDGFIYMAGRKDNQVKIGGNRVEIEEVEARMKNCFAVKECAVTVSKDSKGDNSLIAFVIPTDEHKADEQLDLFLQIKKEMMIEIEHYKIPQKILFLNELPKTNTGKIDRNKLNLLV